MYNEAHNIILTAGFILAVTLLMVFIIVGIKKLKRKFRKKGLSE